MSDLSEKQASGSTKISGADSTGVEDNFLEVDSSGQITSKIKDSSGTAITVGQKTMTSSLPVAVASDQSALPIYVTDGHHLDALGRIRVSDMTQIESLHFANSTHALRLNTAVTGSATSTYSPSTTSTRLTCTTSSSDSVIVQTRNYFRYNAGKSYIMTISGNMGAPKTNVHQRWGYFDANNGLFFSQTSSGLAINIRTNSSGSPVDTTIAQASWNLDKLDGTGSSGVTLDPSKHNLYVIDFLWHGAGRVRFGIVNHGQIVYCHEFLGSNTIATPYMRSPSRPVRVELTNTGTTASATTLDVVCLSFIQEAQDPVVAPYVFSAATGRTSTNVGSTTLPIISIRPKTTFNGITNRVPILPSSVSVAANQQTILVSLVLNATLTGASWTSANSYSAAEYDIASTAVSGGTVLKQFYVAASSSLSSTTAGTSVQTLSDLLTLNLDIAGTTADILTVTAISTAGGSTTFGQIDWVEYQ